jgi:carboxypeptidase Q
MDRRSFLSSTSLLTALPARAAGSAAEPYREVASRLIGAALTDVAGMEKLVYLCDRIGARLAGSEALTRAIAWSAETMRKDGLENVATPPVMVPVWIRGKESARLVSPQARELPMLGLGGSVATPPEGITADVVAVSSFAEFEALEASRVEGRIVLFNAPYEGYGSTVRYRSSGPSRAAEKGASACLIRSVTPVSLQSPHTGALRYDIAAPKIPAAALTVEDAEMLARLQARGVTPRVKLHMEARSAGDAESANVVGEIPGREKPNEVVVVGGHIDSWDVGEGAQDDGSGCLAALQAVVLAKQLGLRPRRTLRVCFWTNEENGLRGGNAYRLWAEARGEKHVAAIEMDGGAERPTGFGVGIRARSATPDREVDNAVAKLEPIGLLLAGIGAEGIVRGGGGADISPLMNAGVPGLGLRTVGEKYFHWHHTHADTVDKVDLQDFRRCMAALAVMSYVLADMPETLVA